MQREVRPKKDGKGVGRTSFGKVMKFLCSGEQIKTAGQMVPSPDSRVPNNYSTNDSSSIGSGITRKLENNDIEEAELSLRESGSLNFEEARALLGRIEYQKGNIEGALQVFEGIDISAVTPKIKTTLSTREDHRKRRSRNHAAPPMSIRTVSLLFEAFFLKAKSQQHLGRFQEAAQSCKAILDIVESSLPKGVPENFGGDCKLQDTLAKAVELLPELWKLADSHRETVLSYRAALLNHWNLDAQTIARIQKRFAVFLLYCGDEATPPNLRVQMDISFVPRNNIEEAILLLMILLRKVNLKRIELDPSILDHLSYALSVAGDTRDLARQVEELLPEIIDRKEMYYTLSLCYLGAGEDFVALDLLRKLLTKAEDPDRVPALLMASKICGEHPSLAEEGISFARRSLEKLDGRCDHFKSSAHCLLGISLSARSRSCVTDSERVIKQTEALKVLETAARMSRMRDPNILYHLSLENAEQRKLDAALYYAKSLVKLGSGCNVKSWLLLARILSAQKQFETAETIIGAAVDQTAKWHQGELLRTKAKIHIAQRQLKSAIEIYTQLLALLQVQNKSSGSRKKLHKGHSNPIKSLELDVWHDLAYLYISLSQWRDAETCLSRSKALKSYSTTRYHATGTLYKEKGLHQEALNAFTTALDLDPTHVPSLVSMADILNELGSQSNAVVKSFLMEALRRDKMNHTTWYKLGLLYKAEGEIQAAVESFEAGALLEETAPIEPFR